MNGYPRHKSNRGDRAFLLVEVLVAVAIFSIVGLRVYEGLAASRRLHHLAIQVEAAAGFAQSQIEWIRSQDPDNLPRGDSFPFWLGDPGMPGPPHEIESATGTLRIRDATPGLVHVAVALSWRRQENERSVQLETLIAVPAGKAAAP